MLTAWAGVTFSDVTATLWDSAAHADRSGETSMRMTLLALAGVMLTSGRDGSEASGGKARRQAAADAGCGTGDRDAAAGPRQHAPARPVDWRRVTIQMRPDVAPRAMSSGSRRSCGSDFYDGTDVPPRHRRLHGAGRRSDRHRHRRIEAAQPQGRVQRRCRTSAGAVAMARARSPDSANSQFFIVPATRRCRSTELYRCGDG